MSRQILLTEDGKAYSQTTVPVPLDVVLKTISGGAGLVSGTYFPKLLKEGGIVTVGAEAFPIVQIPILKLLTWWIPFIKTVNGKDTKGFIPAWEPGSDRGAISRVAAFAFPPSLHTWLSITMQGRAILFMTHGRKAYRFPITNQWENNTLCIPGFEDPLADGGIFHAFTKLQKAFETYPWNDHLFDKHPALRASLFDLWAVDDKFNPLIHNLPVEEQERTWLKLSKPATDLRVKSMGSILP